MKEKAKTNDKTSTFQFTGLCLAIEEAAHYTENQCAQHFVHVTPCIAAASQP